MKLRSKKSRVLAFVIALATTGLFNSAIAQESDEQNNVLKEEKGDYRAVLAGKSNAFRYCYEKQLQQKPDLAGEVTLKFTISEEGYVAEAQVADSTLESKRVERCLIRLVKRARFSKPDGTDAQVEYEMTFDAK